MKNLINKNVHKSNRERGLKAMKKIIPFLVITLFLISGGRGLTLSPQTFEFTLDKGESVINSIALLNDKNYTVDLTINKQGSIANWILLEYFSTSLEQGQEKTLSFSIYVPSDATYGDYTGQITFKELGGNQTNTYQATITVHVKKGKVVVYEGSISTEQYLIVGPYKIYLTDVGMTSTCLITVSTDDTNLTTDRIVDKEGIVVGNLSISALSTFVGKEEQKCTIKVEANEKYNYELKEIAEEIPEDVIKVRGVVAPGGWIVIETSVNDKLVGGSLLIEIPESEPISMKTSGLANFMVPEDAGGKPMTITYYDSKGTRLDYLVVDVSSEAVSTKGTNMNVIVKDKFKSDEDIVFQIIDDKNLEPIEGVKIYLDVPCDVDRWGMTDSNGVVSFKGDWCEGIYQYKATRKGYEDVFGNLTVEVIRKEIRLLPLLDGEVQDTLISGKTYTFEVVDEDNNRIKDYDYTAEITVGNNTYNLRFSSGRATFEIPQNADEITFSFPKTDGYLEYEKTYYITNPEFKLPFPIIYMAILSVVVAVVLMLLKKGKISVRKKGPIIAPQESIERESFPVEEE